MEGESIESENKQAQVCYRSICVCAWLLLLPVFSPLLQRRRKEMLEVMGKGSTHGKGGVRAYKACARAGMDVL